MKQIPGTRSTRLVADLRAQIIRSLHLGRLRPDDRLPSIRQVAADSGCDHRAVARAYRELEREGWVMIRGRGGVFVAGRQAAAASELTEAARPLASLFAHAWKQQFHLGSLLRNLEVCARRTLRCACVESLGDVLVDLTAQLRDEWGFEVRPVQVPHREDGSVEGATELAAQIADVDFVVTTSFHAASVSEAARAAGKPFVMLTMHPAYSRELQRWIRDSGVLVVCTDNGLGGRLRTLFPDAINDRDQVRAVHPRDAHAVAALRGQRVVLVTRAARELLGEAPFPCTTLAPDLSPQSAEALVNTWLRLSLAPEMAAV